MKRGVWFFTLTLILAAFDAPGEEVRAQSPVFRARTDLVYLPVTVTDRKGKLIKGLEAGDFRIFEEGAEQRISYFGHEQLPLTVGLVLDRSGSMTMMMDEVYTAALHVLDDLAQGDQAFAMTFNREVLLVQPMTQDFDSLRSALKGLNAEGSTALYDAVQKALEYVEGAGPAHWRKALCVITDGEDTASITDYRELLKKAEEADVTIYTVAMSDRTPFLQDLLGGDSQNLLRRLAEATGGKYHNPSNLKECEKAMKDINEELRSQYGLGYYPPDSEGKSWRRVNVGFSNGKKKLVARTRQGYFR